MSTNTNTNTSIEAIDQATIASAKAKSKSKQVNIGCCDSSKAWVTDIQALPEALGYSITRGDNSKAISEPELVRAMVAFIDANRHQTRPVLDAEGNETDEMEDFDAFIQEIKRELSLRAPKSEKVISKVKTLESELEKSARENAAILQAKRELEEKYQKMLEKLMKTGMTKEEALELVG
jgi:hypothetical protein